MDKEFLESWYDAEPESDVHKESEAAAQESTAEPSEVELISDWQRTKESWYDKVPLTVKQLDIIIACGFIGLIITAIAIAMDAMGIF